MHPELGNSLYDLHSDGSGICYSSRLRPVLNMRPKAMSSTAGIGSMLWGYNADTHLTDWLEAEGFAFDVATDEDLHAEGAALLGDYRVGADRHAPRILLGGDAAGVARLRRAAAA